MDRFSAVRNIRSPPADIYIYIKIELLQSSMGNTNTEEVDMVKGNRIW